MNPHAAVALAIARYHNPHATRGNSKDNDLATSVIEALRDGAVERTGKLISRTHVEFTSANHARRFPDRVVAIILGPEHERGTDLDTASAHEEPSSVAYNAEQSCAEWKS